MTLPPMVEEWRDRGRFLSLGDQESVFTIDRGPRDGPTLLVLHGFPASTFDWRLVITDLEVDHRVVGHDLVGFGLSTKPAGASYSLFTQADRTVRVLGDLGVERAVVVAHDLGDTVAAELLHRHRHGDLPFDVAGCVLTNGSIFIDLAQLTDGQQMLLSLPDEPLAEPLGAELLRAGLAATFPPGSIEAAELAAIAALIEHRGGDLLMPRLIRYIDERRRNQDRWTAGLAETAVPMAAAWGELDPIAVPTMVDRLQQLRGANGALEVVRWPDVGHWPPVERPGELAALIRAWATKWW